MVMKHPWRAVLPEHNQLAAAREVTNLPRSVGGSAWAWRLRLECGHATSRAAKYTIRDTPWMGPRSVTDVRPAPERVRCADCPMADELQRAVPLPSDQMRAGLRDASWAVIPSRHRAHVWHMVAPGTEEMPRAACNSTMPLMAASVTSPAEVFDDVRCRAKRCRTMWLLVPSRPYSAALK